MRMRVPKQGTGTEQSVVGMKPAKAGRPKGLRHSASNDGQPGSGRSRSSEAKPFEISKKIVWEAYEKVKKNRGAAGIDSETIEEFEADLKNNLYRIWNRMSSGTYFPPPVRSVEIEKSDGGTRTLGIPSVSDRVAQTVAKLYLEPIVEPHFDPDSYGYRPGKSAIDAVRAARTNCWRFDWLIDLDVRAFFDSLDHELAMRAIRRYTSCPWILLYMERWLKAPLQNEDGTLVARERGTPQGGVVSPVAANLFLHLAFDAWMRERHPGVPFERYADDIIVHCKTEAEAQVVLRDIERRLARCKLELHPEKTKIVYCKDSNRTGTYPTERFTFLGYEFRPRLSRNHRGQTFVSFSPAVSPKATRAMRREMKRWRLHLRSGSRLEDIAQDINPVVRGWIQYYGVFCKTALCPFFKHLNRRLICWAMRKYKRLRRHQRRAAHWLESISRREPSLLAHWIFLRAQSTAG